MSRCTSDSAWVSTSSVKNTFFTPSSLISDWPFVAMQGSLMGVVGLRPSVFVGCTREPRKTNGRLPTTLFHPHPIVSIPPRHIRDDDLIAFLESFDDFDGVDRRAAQLDGD